MIPLESLRFCFNPCVSRNSSGAMYRNPILLHRFGFNPCVSRNSSGAARPGRTYYLHPGFNPCVSRNSSGALLFQLAELVEVLFQSVC